MWGARKISEFKIHAFMSCDLADLVKNKVMCCRKVLTCLLLGISVLSFGHLLGDSVSNNLVKI